VAPRARLQPGTRGHAAGWEVSTPYGRSPVVTALCAARVRGRPPAIAVPHVVPRTPEPVD